MKHNKFEKIWVPFHFALYKISISKKKYSDKMRFNSLRAFQLQKTITIEMENTSRISKIAKLMNTIECAAAVHWC